MKKVTPNGNLIKQLRLQLEKGSLQKEMEHAVGISMRKIRLIENENASVTVPELDRIAAYLNVSRDQIYYTHQMRHLPERYDLPAEGEPSEMKFRIASVLGPPGEYGEESLDVNVDNGQPYFMKGWNSKKQGENEGC